MSTNGSFIRRLELPVSPIRWRRGSRPRTVTRWFAEVGALCTLLGKHGGPSRRIALADAAAERRYFHRPLAAFESPSATRWRGGRDAANGGIQLLQLPLPASSDGRSARVYTGVREAFGGAGVGKHVPSSMNPWHLIIA